MENLTYVTNKVLEAEQKSFGESVATVPFVCLTENCICVHKFMEQFYVC